MKSHWRFLASLMPDKTERKIYEQYFIKEHAGWIKAGRPLPVSNFVKHQALKQLQEKFKVEVFVETGTYLGDTLYAVYDQFDRLYSVELSNLFFERAKKRFKNKDKVNLMQGDSGEVLKTLVPKLERPAIFWLDGHYSGGLTARGEKDCPIIEELKAVFNSPFKHFIFIDDARVFVGKNDYPTIDELRNFVATHKPDYSLSIENDCIQLLPIN